MFKVAVKTFFKVMFALGAIFTALVVAQKLLESKSDYIEIYNDADEDEEDMF